jgi:hypothetical protein
MGFAAMLCARSVLVLSLAVAGGAGSLVPDSKLKRELDAQLPPESRYSFPPVSDKWVKTLWYVDPVLLEAHKPEEVSAEQKKRFDKKEVLSATGKEEGDRRVVTHDPDGKLRFVGDWRGNDAFTQRLHANGSIGEYMHGRKDKVLEAYTVSPHGSDVHRVVRGNGMLKRYADEPNSFLRVGYYEGVQFFRAYYVGERLDHISLKANNDELLRWRNGSEEFFIENKRTWWGRASAKGPIILKRLDGEYDLKKLNPERVKMWEGKYPESIAGFLDRYDAHLKKAGYTWAKLGIEFVRMKMPFPAE